MTTILGIVAALALTGCIDAEYPSCKKDKHCRQDLEESCVDGLCQGCRTDSECNDAAGPGSWMCLEFRCQPASELAASGAGDPLGASASPCTSDASCPATAICDSGRCVTSAARVEVHGGEPEWNTEGYDHVVDSEFVAVVDEPLSTFSVDVDTAAYSNVRRFLKSGRLPPPDAVRVEELVNYFTYDYPLPTKKAPFSVTSEVGPCPWGRGTQLVHLGLRGEPLPAGTSLPRNLVFLLDVSGSMDMPNKLPLLKQSMKLLTRQLTASDRIAIVVYAGASGLVLPTTPGDDRAAILEAIENLGAAGSTNGGEGIELAYDTAVASFADKGINRVILATDGDFNVGVTSRGALVRLIEQKRKTGVALTVLGFGEGNLKDSSMEQLADKGNGNYAYIDSLLEAQKVLIEEAGGTFVTIAKDVKIQVEFNPAKVSEYRLIGYQNRRLETQDFTDDRKDAGEIGADHTVTALYEIRRASPGIQRKPDKLRYQGVRSASPAAGSDELMNLKIRFKRPRGSKSHEIAAPITDGVSSLAKTSDDFRFSSAVAAFSMLLRDSAQVRGVGYDGVLRLAQGAKGADASGHRSEFLRLVRLARDLDDRRR